MIKIAVNGARGRMGSRILSLAQEAPKEFKIVGVFDHAGTQAKIQELSEKALKNTDVLIDFSSPEGTKIALKMAIKTKTRLVIGTTGIDDDGIKKIQAASKKIAVLFSPNMSLGANFLFEVARLAASKLKADYDVEIVEAHHRLKKDAPSGTAKKIQEVIANERAGKRPPTHSIRVGEIVGEHTIIFSGPGETIELVHRAQSRDAFARGSLAAAIFLSTKSKGLYSMADVLQ